MENLYDNQIETNYILLEGNCENPPDRSLHNSESYETPFEQTTLNSTIIPNSPSNVCTVSIRK